MKNIKVKFNYNRFYHVFNRTNNREILFKNNENKKYFLNLIRLRLYGYVKFYSYALLDNHFHFAISIPAEDEIINHILSVTEGDRRKSETDFLESEPEKRDVHKFISTQWSRVFNSYTQAFNKKFKRNGHLFHAPFKRSEVYRKQRLLNLIYYIHHNSRRHRLVQNFLSDQWHSYLDILEDREFFLENEYVLDLFGGKDAFIEFHQEEHLKDS